MTRSYVCVIKKSRTAAPGRNPGRSACGFFYDLLIAEDNAVVVWISSAAEQPFYPDRSYK